jgi:TonB family protein
MNSFALLLSAALPVSGPTPPAAAAAQDTAFWDGEWRHVSRANAVYYGWVTPLDSGRCLVQHFYRTGEREMEAAARSGPVISKEGPVTYYYRSGPKRATGQFVHNKREGTWQYWREDGTLRLQKKFAGGIEMLTFTQPADADSKVPQIVEQMPAFPGPMSVVQYLASTIHRPAGAPPVHGDGKVFVQFVVGPEGNVISTRIIKSFDSAYDAEVLRAVVELPRWKPGRQNGEPVAVRFVVPVVFN